MTIKLVQLLLSAIFVSYASASFCMHVREATCDWTRCDYEFEGVRNWESLGSIYFMVPIGLPHDDFYCSDGNEWCHNPKRNRVKACNQEADVKGGWCADIC
ncbi:MAG: hypothetical protein BYD32DRAFT_441969 [Podila humilis]|nr:MAG: hypothetical protein BYD32DRAFT_441969 [Podila humilis]